MTREPTTSIGSSSQIEPRRPVRAVSPMGVRRAADRLSNLVPLYPLVAMTLVYGEWLLAWAVLGRQPIPSIDQPSSIPISGWVHHVAFGVLIAAVPMGCLAIVLEMLRAAADRSADRLFTRLIGFGTLWLGMYSVIRWDPGHILSWFTD